MPPLDPRLQQGTVPPGAPPPEAPPEEQPPPQDGARPEQADEMQMGTQQASPEEQDMADQFVGRAWELIYNDNIFPQVVQMLEGGAGPDQTGETQNTSEGDPVKGLAMATDMIVGRVAMAADQNGVAVPPDVMFHASGDILEELAEVSRRGKIKDYSKDQDALERAWFDFLDMFRERLASVGEIDQADAKQGLDKLMRADQNGTLEKIMRDLANSDRSGTAGGPAGEEPPPEQRQPPPPRRGLGQAAGMQ